RISSLTSRAMSLIVLFLLDSAISRDTLSSACPTHFMTHRSLPLLMTQRIDQQSAAPNSPLKLTVRRRFSRRPSRLPRLEFARRRAACTGIIGCAASGAPLDAGRHAAARNLTSGRWADEAHRSSYLNPPSVATQMPPSF